MTGSGTLVSWLLREGLLDELHLLVFPVVLGSRGPAARRIVMRPGGYGDAVSATRVLMPWQGRGVIS